jgi:hypothetical protein
MFFTLMVGALGVLPDLRQHLPESPPLMFFTLIVGATESSSAPPKGPSLIFHSVDGGRSQILQLRHLSGSPPSMFLIIDGGRSWIYSSGTSQGARCRHFLH